MTRLLAILLLCCFVMSAHAQQEKFNPFSQEVYEVSPSEQEFDCEPPPFGLEQLKKNCNERGTSRKRAEHMTPWERAKRYQEWRDLPGSRIKATGAIKYEQ